jgi:sugar (pentulose or hexulose) kinase
LPADQPLEGGSAMTGTANDRRPAASSVVLGVDIGTTSTKVVGFDPTGRAWGSHSVGYPLEEPEPGQAVQDPDRILRAVIASITAAAAETAERGAQVRGLSFSTAMHSLIALDGNRRPLTGRSPGPTLEPASRPSGCGPRIWA